MTNAEFKPHAYITESNSGGIEIMLNRSNDGLYYRWNYGQNDLVNTEIFEAEIQYDQEGEAYFIHHANFIDRIIYLNEAMKTNF